MSCECSHTTCSNTDEQLNIKNELRPIISSAVLFIIGLAFYDYFHNSYYSFLEYLIFLVAYLIVGFEILKKSYNNIKKGEVFDENFLMSIATIGAILIHQMPEAVGVMLFFRVGEFFQDLAVSRSKRSIKKLIDLRPDYANLVLEKGTKKTSPTKVSVGDIILVKVGEKVPLDGVLLESDSMFDTVALTGESVPRKIHKNEEVLAGMINVQNVVKIRVSKPFAESSFSKIIKLVESANSSKSNTEKFITKFSRYYTPVVVVCALLLALIPPLFIEGEMFKEWIYRGLIFLVISCPCALVISIPLGFFGGIGGASKKGILVKGANYLEQIRNLDTMVVDKTGTLTKGVFKVVKINPQNGFTTKQVKEFAAYAELHSNHPIAESIKNNFKGKINPKKVKNCSELAGLGVKATVNNKLILLGNKKMLQKFNIAHDDNIVSQGMTQVHLVVDKVYAGCIYISDEIKPGVKESLNALTKMGVRKIVMLTGDNKDVAEMVAKDLGIKEFHSNLYPEDKLNIVKDYRKEGLKVGFVGDGINDAPVLAEADIGFAMGDVGSDVAIESADVVLINGDTGAIAQAMKVSKNTMKIVWQNIGLAFLVKGAVLYFGALGLVTMWGAVFADVGVALLAVLNSIRTLK